VRTSEEGGDGGGCLLSGGGGVAVVEVVGRRGRKRWGKQSKSKLALLALRAETFSFNPHPDGTTSPCNLTGLGPLIFRIEAE